MGVKKYALPSEAIAEELILALQNEDSENTDFKQVTVTQHTHAVVCLGFQHEWGVDENDEPIMLVESLTYDVDVFWKGEPSAEWSQYEINPNNPKHTFA